MGKREYMNKNRAIKPYGNKNLKIIKTNINGLNIIIGITF